MIDRATRTGELFCNDGSVINEADILKNSTDYSGARIVMNELHAFIHRGIVFDLSAKIIIPSETTVYLTGQTNGKTVHFHKENYTSNAGGIEFKLLEGVTATGGSAMTPINRNRASTTQSTLIVKSGATVTQTGTELYLIGFPESATPSRASSLSGGETLEWVLKPQTFYAIQINNFSNAERTVYAELCWYEV